MSSDKKTKTCIRSGLEFETTNNRIRVHPSISPWTQHKDWKTRSTANDVILRGKEEGWESLEKFEEEIRYAIAAEECPQFPEGVVVRVRQSSSRGGYAKPWVSKVDSTTNRTFLNPFSTNKGGEWVFVVVGDGFYEVCDRNSKGDERRSWFKIQDGLKEDIEQGEFTAAIAPEIEGVEIQVVGGVKAAWVARITGLHPKFKFERQFLQPTKVEGDRRWFTLPEDGIYQGVNYENTSKQTPERVWWQLRDGGLREITEADVEENFNKGKDSQDEDLTGCKEFRLSVPPGRIFTDPRAGSGDRENYYLSVKLDNRTTYDPDWEEDVDDSITYGRPLTDSEWRDRVLAPRERKEKKKYLFDKISELAVDIEIPTDLKPIWSQDRNSFVAIEGEYIFRGRYNGRDGDLWAINNWGNYVVTAAPATEELKSLVAELFSGEG